MADAWELDWDQSVTFKYFNILKPRCCPAILFYNWHKKYGSASLRFHCHKSQWKPNYLSMGIGFTALSDRWVAQHQGSHSCEPEFVSGSTVLVWCALRIMFSSFTASMTLKALAISPLSRLLSKKENLSLCTHRNSTSAILVAFFHLSLLFCVHGVWRLEAHTHFSAINLKHMLLFYSQCLFNHNILLAF